MIIISTFAKDIQDVPISLPFLEPTICKMAIYIWDRNVQNEHDVILKKTWN